MSFRVVKAAFTTQNKEILSMKTTVISHTTYPIFSYQVEEFKTHAIALAQEIHNLNKAHYVKGRKRVEFLAKACGYTSFAHVAHASVKKNNETVALQLFKPSHAEEIAKRYVEISSIEFDIVMAGMIRASRRLYNTLLWKEAEMRSYGEQVLILALMDVGMRDFIESVRKHAMANLSPATESLLNQHRITLDQYYDGLIKKSEPCYGGGNANNEASEGIISNLRNIMFTTKEIFIKTHDCYLEYGLPLYYQEYDSMIGTLTNESSKRFAVSVKSTHPSLLMWVIGDRITEDIEQREFINIEDFSVAYMLEVLECSSMVNGFGRR
jgi:flagellar basal body rod protein FlgC